ncbi:MAG: flagellar motor switch protein FliM [Candidatus Omnitrophota bacterium]|nr:MAG: flagellar motor switch protein FliM [Candidatus Omnitrophota bacterium]
MLETEVYDFEQPERVSKDAMRGISLLYENFARILSSDLTTYLRSIIEISLDNVRQLTYNKFAAELANPGFFNVFELQSIEGKAVLEISLNIVFSLIDRLLGGTGSADIAYRELTEIEQKVLGTIIDKVVIALKNTWQPVAPIVFKPLAQETNPQFVRIVPPNEFVVVVDCRVGVGGQTGVLKVVVPVLSLEPVLNKLNIEQKNHKQQIDKKAMIEMGKKLQTIIVPLNAFFSSAKITLQQILEMKEGDIIKLPMGMNNPVNVAVKGKIKFYGRIGVKDNSRAVQIVECR